MTGRSRARDRSRPSGVRATVAAWTISDISPLLWVRADQGVTGSPVSAWASIVAGGGSLTQGTVASQPAAATACARLNNHLALTYDGGDRLYGNAALDLSAAWTFFSAFDVGALKNEHSVLRVADTELSGTPGGLCIYAVLDGRLVVGNVATTWTRVCTSGLTANTAHVLLASCDGTSGGITIELGVIGGGSIAWTTLTLGALSGSFAMPASTGQKFCSGAGWSSASSLFIGQIADQAIWGRVLSAGEKSSLKTYAARYA